ncbi:NADH dehydrogenase [Rhizophagus clarus]|uniref:NADH dehydrogenase n=1 Tax=Rhizophagus clarus TaxID=94130 RepID=A0A8H3LKU1_9GLOM|nr:NADH dehydrogenase [Rhizophagus clarus]
MASWEYPTHKTFPIVPPLNEVEPSDRPGILDAREQKIREDWIKVMELRLIRDQLRKCYKTESKVKLKDGNHLMNLNHLKSKIKFNYIQI